MILVLYKQKSGFNSTSNTNVTGQWAAKSTTGEGPANSVNGATGLTVVISRDDATLPSKDKMATPKKEPTTSESKENGANP